MSLRKGVNMKHEFRMYVGPMFGGKTTRMLSQVERYSYQGLDTLLFKPRMDERYDSNSVVTHTGMKNDAIRVRTGNEINEFLAKK